MLKGLGKNLSIALLILGAVIPVPVQGQINKDQADRFEVYSPVPRTLVHGTIELKYLAYDDDQASLPFKIEIMDEACAVKQRTILNTNIPVSRTSQVYGWNTQGTYSDGAALTDGNYCLNVCADLKNDASGYNICNLRNLTIRTRNNSAPDIISLPRLEITQGSDYSYTVAAVDPEKDRMFYGIIRKPNFLTFSNGTLSGKNIRQVGKFPVSVLVQDEFGSRTEQSFVLEVKSPTGTTIKASPIVSFVYPQIASVLKGTNNKIEWGVSNWDQAQSLVLQYRKSDGTWKELYRSNNAADIKPGDSFTWDVSKLTNGEYELRILVKDVAGVEIETISPKFIINNGNDGTNSFGEVAVTDIKPENGSVVGSLRPDISATISITGDDPLTIDKIKFILDGNDKTNLCSLQQSAVAKTHTLSCKLDQDLTSGNHSLEIHVGSFSRSWQFTLGPVTPSDSYNILGLVLPIATFNLICLLCLVLFILILLPLLLYILWRRRSAASVYEGQSTKVIWNPVNGPVQDVFSTTSKPEAVVSPSLPDLKTLEEIDELAKSALEIGKQSTTEDTEPLKAAITESIPTESAPVEAPKPSLFENLKQKIKEVIASRMTVQPSQNLSPEVEPVNTADMLAGEDFSWKPHSKEIQTPATTVVEPVVEPVIDPEVKLETQPVFVQPEVVSTPVVETAQPVKEDIPAWLQDSPKVEESSPVLPGKEKEEDDGSDPYGFGEFTIGEEDK